MTAGRTPGRTPGRTGAEPARAAAGTARVSAAWLALREPADAAARARDLVEPVRRQLAGPSRAVIHDLGCGTGSMGRWLAAQVPGPQHWILHDRDGELLELAATGMTGAAPDGAPVTVETRRSDITRLGARDLAGAGLVTASALLDMLTAEELERIVATCAEAGCPALLTISVTGRVELTPSDPLDREVGEAFDDHQRRTVDGRALLGPDAVESAVEAFARRGIDVLARPSPWRLGPEQARLAAAWFTGWVDAACEQRPELAGPAATYRARRLAQAAAGRLRVVVQHQDLLARPGG